jgi:chromosome partitioning protein
VNIGAGLALKGARVLLVDVDAQGNLALALGVRPRRTLYEMLIDGAKAADCISHARPNLDLIAGDAGLLSVQTIIAKRPDWSRALEHGLRPLIGEYDFVLIDSGGSLTTLTTNALNAASDVIVPTAIEHFSLKSIELLFTQIAQIKGNRSSVRLIIPTLFDPRVRQSGELLEQLRARYGALVADPIRVNVRLSEAPTLGQTIYEYDPRSRGAVDYALLVERISTMFGFRAVPREMAHTMPPTPDSAPPSASQFSSTSSGRASVGMPPPAPAPPSVGIQRRPPAATNGLFKGPPACPNCGQPLQHATLAGYRVSYCDNCKYKTQTLAQGPRR